MTFFVVVSQIQGFERRVNPTCEDGEPVCVEPVEPVAFVPQTCSDFRGLYKNDCPMDRCKWGASRTGKVCQPLRESHSLKPAAPAPKRDGGKKKEKQKRKRG